MTQRWKSALTGAAVAAILTLPAAAESWLNGPTRNFSVHSVDIRDLVGHLTVGVRPGPVTIQVSGTKSRVDETAVHQDGDALEVVGETYNQVWDWRHWFDFSDRTHWGDLSVKLFVPKGTAVRVDDLVGDAQIGDTLGPLHFGAVSTNSTIGRVGEAHLSLAGSGKIVAGDIMGDLHADSAGSGKIVAGSARAVHADVAGSGAIDVGAINGDLSLDIAGSGDFSALSVRGAAHIDIAGSGSVRIAQGQADPFHVDILGSGNVDFGGLAVDPHVSGLGSGSVKIHQMRGKLSSDGMADVKIGS